MVQMGKLRDETVRRLVLILTHRGKHDAEI